MLERAGGIQGWANERTPSWETRPNGTAGPGGAGGGILGWEDEVPGANSEPDLGWGSPKGSPKNDAGDDGWGGGAAVADWGSPPAQGAARGWKDAEGGESHGWGPSPKAAAGVQVNGWPAGAMRQGSDARDDGSKGGYNDPPGYQAPGYQGGQGYRPQGHAEDGWAAYGGSGQGGGKGGGVGTPGGTWQRSPGDGAGASRGPALSEMSPHGRWEGQVPSPADGWSTVRSRQDGRAATRSGWD